jgi:hypothetical protein
MSLPERTTGTATDTDRVLLYLAAHDGEQVHLDVLSDALGLSVVAIDEAVAQLSRRGLIEPDGYDSDSTMVTARVTMPGYRRTTANAPAQVVGAIRQLLESVAR